jgi:hypothetical protein
MLNVALDPELTTFVDATAVYVPEVELYRIPGFNLDQYVANGGVGFVVATTDCAVVADNVTAVDDPGVALTLN